MRRREEPASGPEEFFHLGGHDGVFRGVKWKGGGKRNFKSATKPSSADSEVIYGAHILSYVRHLAGGGVSCWTQTAATMSSDESPVTCHGDRFRR